jgi:hypothetical protein
MTDKPRTMTLTPEEWRALIYTGANSVSSYVGLIAANTPPDPTAIMWFHEALDRLKMQVSAWGASGQQPTGGLSQGLVNEVLDVQAKADAIIANGGGVTPAEPKKKRGWQKGRKRGPRKPKQTEAVQ